MADKEDDKSQFEKGWDLGRHIHPLRCHVNLCRRVEFHRSWL